MSAISTLRGAGSIMGTTMQGLGNGLVSGGSTALMGGNTVGGGLSSGDLAGLGGSLASDLQSQVAETKMLNKFQQQTDLIQQEGKAVGKAADNANML